MPIMHQTKVIVKLYECHFSAYCQENLLPPLPIRYGNKHGKQTFDTSECSAKVLYIHMNGGELYVAYCLGLQRFRPKLAMTLEQ